MQKAVVEAEHRVSDLIRDVDNHVAKIVRLEQQVELQRGELTHMERENASLVTTRDELKECLTADRNKHEKLDSFVGELKVCALLVW